MNADEIISAVSGRKHEEVIKNIKKSKRMNELRNELMKEIGKIVTTGTELLTYISANISTMLIALPKEARMMILIDLIKREEEGKNDELMEQIKKFQD